MLVLPAGQRDEAPVVALQNLGNGIANIRLG
jgi:hypothetical protein